MTTDYSKLDTESLVQAADALMAEITPGAWELVENSSIASSYAEQVARFNYYAVSKVSGADAAFIAAAPALVRALVARLRESVTNG